MAFAQCNNASALRVGRFTVYRPARSNVVAQCKPGTDASELMDVPKESEVAAPDEKPTMARSEVELETPQGPQGFFLLTRTQELINSRAAMLGIIAAAASEWLSGQSVVTQMTGKVVDGEVVARAHGESFLFYGAIVALLTYASLMPRMLSDEQPKDREVGPFSEKAELWNGRAAMLGFFSLVVIECLRGQTPLF